MNSRTIQLQYESSTQPKNATKNSARKSLMIFADEEAKILNYNSIKLLYVSNVRYLLFPKFGEHSS